MFPQIRLQVYPIAVEIVGMEAANIEFPPGGFIAIALCCHVGSSLCGTGPLMASCMAPPHLSTSGFAAAGKLEPS